MVLATRLLAVAPTIYTAPPNDHHPPPNAPQVLAYHVTDYFRQIYTRKII